MIGLNIKNALSLAQKLDEKGEHYKIAYANYNDIYLLPCKYSRRSVFESFLKGPKDESEGLIGTIIKSKPGSRRNHS